MMRLMRFFKPYLASIALIIALLFVQANADLALPDYMSRIVNVGILQGGIDEAVPSILGGSTLEKALAFAKPAEQELILAAYVKLEPGSAAESAARKKYPGAADEALYAFDQAVADSPSGSGTSSAIGSSLAAVALVRQVAENPGAARQAAAGQASQGISLDLSRLPPGADLFTILPTLPDAQRSMIVESVRGKLDALDPAIAGQMAIRAVQDEYKRLGADLESIQTLYIIKIGGYMILLTLLSAAATVAVGFLGARTAAGFARDLRSSIFRTVEGFSLAELDKFSTASLITRSTNDITQLQMVTVMGLRMFFYAPIIGVGGVIRATGKASSMWWIIALAVSIILGVIIVVFAVALPKFKSIQKLIDRLNLVVRENLTGMMVIRAFDMQSHEEKRFDKANQDLTGTMLFVTRVMVVLMPLMMLIMNLVSLLVVWVGAREVAQSQIRIGDMMAFMQYAMQIFFAFIMLSMMFILLPRASVSGDRIAEVLATRPSVADRENPGTMEKDFSGTVEFKDVSFRYPGASEDVLHRITFTAKPGQTTAIIGTTGSGKSTLVNLIPRFYDATEGAVLVGGTDVREIAQRDLREGIGYVPQKASLFSGTIESNLRYANEDATSDDLALALEISQASEFVASRPEGMGLEISQGGTNVSGGQRQRLTIARALVRRAPIVIFDDSFSALDFKTDTKLRRALKSNLGGSTVILVTQRVAAIRQADQILVLDEGRMVGLGTHAELMRTCEVYRDIATSQLTREELA